MEIRKAQVNDLSILVELEKQLYKSSFTKDNLSYELNENPYSNTIVLIENKEIIGAAIYWVIFDQAQIVKIGVLEKYQEKGNGKLLLDYLINDSKKQEAEIITLEVRISNKKAIEFYKKNNFEIVSTRKGYYTNPSEDAYLMMRSLI